MGAAQTSHPPMGMNRRVVNPAQQGMQLMQGGQQGMQLMQGGQQGMQLMQSGQQGMQLMQSGQQTFISTLDNATPYFPTYSKSAYV